jgi:hypothetical protein
MTDHSPSDEAVGYGCLILLVIVGSVGYGGYSALNSGGWIPHTVDSTITAQGNWIVGESKDCYSTPLDLTTANAEGKPMGYALQALQCDDGPIHQIKVEFYGRSEQPGISMAEWRCTRNESGFTCKQTGAIPVEGSHQVH